MLEKNPINSPKNNEVSTISRPLTLCYNIQKFQRKGKDVYTLSNSMQKILNLH